MVYFFFTLLLFFARSIFEVDLAHIITKADILFRVNNLLLEHYFFPCREFFVYLVGGG